MGGYILTNDISDESQSSFLELFREKGLENYHVIDFNPYRLYYFEKRNIAGPAPIYRSESSVLVGVGTFIYNGAIGRKALSNISRDLASQNSESVFNEIKGHFNLVIYSNGDLVVVSDRIGSYHSFYGMNDEHLYISSSLLAIAKRMNSITPRKQEIMEFIITEAFYGPRTVFEEISFLAFGHIHHIKESGEINSKKYHVAKDCSGAYDLEHHFSSICDYIAPLKSLDLSITSDLTAGYDSRLICSILKHLNIPHNFNTNTNSWDSRDLRNAVFIAREERRKISVYVKDMTNIDYERLVRESLVKTELYRDAVRAAYAPIFFDRKSQDYALSIGGYGGELYRDIKYKGIDDYQTLISNKYLDIDMASIFLEEDIKSYCSQLKQKMSRVVGHGGEALSKQDCERIYYFLRMAYWGGARISHYNQFGYRYHPLMDYKLIHPLFCISDCEKRHAKFQMQLIETFDRKLASYDSGYGHSFLWEEVKSGIPWYGIIKEILLQFKGLLRKVGIGVQSKPRGANALLWRFVVDNQLFIEDTFEGPINMLRKLINRIGIGTVGEGRASCISLWQELSRSSLHLARLFNGLSIRGNETHIGRVYTVEKVLSDFV